MLDCKLDPWPSHSKIEDRSTMYRYGIPCTTALALALALEPSNSHDERYLLASFFLLAC